MGNKVLAFDIGASSGRAVLGELSEDKISISEIHRFSNDPVQMGDHFYWDFPRLLHDVYEGIRKAGLNDGFESVGIDTWGVDYGYLDKNGRLMNNIYHYRDIRNNKAIDRVYDEISKNDLYMYTGIHCVPLNTVFQLMADREEQPYYFKNAETLLMIPDLLNYFLCGVVRTDYSNASNTGLIDVRTRQWSWEVIDALKYPRKIFTPVSMPGEVIGMLTPRLCEELMIPPVKVISTASHDTASAVAAVPSESRDIVYISCGTWSLFGTELPAPCTTDEARELNFTNEGGYGGSIRFLKNIMGLWLIQEARRYWNKTGLDLSFAEMERLSREYEPYQSFVDVDDLRFYSPGDQPGRVRQACRETLQSVPESVGETVQCIYSSIAMKYRYALECLEKLMGRKYKAIHIVGGGTKDNLLCQMTADTCGITVLAGPVEATVVGNVAVQLITLGEIKDLSQARRIIEKSFPLKSYEPCVDRQKIESAYDTYKRILNF